MRRTQSSIPSTTAPSATAGPQSNLYKGELNKKDVQEGYGMGMAVKVRFSDRLWVFLREFPFLRSQAHIVDPS